MMLAWTKELYKGSRFPELIEQWTGKQRVELVVNILKGDTSEGEHYNRSGAGLVHQGNR